MRIADLIPKRLALALACLPIVLSAGARAADVPPAVKEAAPAPAPEAAKPAEEPRPTPAAPAEAAPKPAPNAEAAPKPAPKATDGPAAKPEIRFQFDGIPYDDVIRRFAQMAGKPVLGEYHIEGTLTFFDPKPYTFDEAFDTLNLLLAMRGYTMVATPRFVRVVAMKEATKAPLRIVKGWEEAEQLRPGELATMMLPLKFMSAEDAVRVLMPVVSTYGSVAPLGTGRGIIITDRLENMQRIRVILDELDTGTLSSESVLKTYKLKHASATDIATIVNGLFPASRSASEPKYIRDREGRYTRNPDYGQSEKASDMGVKATADQRTNTLFLAGSGEKIALAEQIIEQLDAIEPGATGDMRVFDLKNARAEDLANTIKQLLPQQPSHSSSSHSSSSRSQGMDARVVADVNTNRLIVTAPLDQMTRIEELIRTLDQASEEVGGMRVFKLKVADAQQLERVIQGAITRSSGDPRSGYGSSRYGSSRSAMTTRVSSDVRTNSLIVSGSASDIQIAEQLIAELDRPLDEGDQTREIHVVQLKVGDARELASSLTRMLEQRDPRGPHDQSSSNVRIAADGGTNSLLISAAPGDWPTIEKLLQQLEASAVPGATASTRVIPVQHAKASELAESLNRIYGSRSSSYGHSYSRSYSRPSPSSVPVVIAADDRSNYLLVSAAEDDQKAIAELVKTMDTPDAEKADAVRMIQVTSGDAVKIADTIRGLMPYPERDQRQTVFVRGDAASNNIMVRAPEADFKVIEQMVKQLDKAMTENGGIRTFRLKTADAQQLAPIIQRAVVRFESGHSHPPDGATVVTADVRTNSLIVAGSAGDIQTAEKIIAELDKPLDEQTREIHVVQLEVGDAREVAQALTRMLAQQSTDDRHGTVSAKNVRIEAESATNSLLISAAPDDWPIIEKILEELKASAAPLATATTRLVPLKHANARELAETLRQVYAARRSSSSYSRYASSRGYGPTTSGATTVPVVIAANERSNSLLISAADDDQNAIAELIKVMDVPAAEGAEPMRMIRLQSADASRLADTLKAMVPRPREGETQSVVIEAEPLSNSVLLRGPEADRKMFEEMIATLDQATQEQAREIRKIPLKHVSATQLAQMLGQLYQTSSGSSSSYRSSRYGYGGSRPTAGDQERVVIAAAPGDRMLVVDAPRDKAEEIANLVASLDVADAPGQVEVRTYRLANAKAGDLAVSLGRLFAEQRSHSGAAADNEPEPRFEPDVATNQIIVAATPTQFTTIDELIKKLEVDTSLARETRTFRLKSAKAADIVEVLQTMLVDTPASASRYGRPSEPTGADVRVAAMPDTNDVVVQGPPEKLALAEELIKTFDADGATRHSAVFIVKLKNAQAASLAEAVNAALAAGTVTSSYSSRHGPPWRAPERSGQEDRVTVTPELNSNSVLVRGPVAEIPAVVEMIQSLDQGSTGTGAEVRVYPLVNGEPSALAESLGRLFQDMLRQQAGGGRNAPVVPFSIAADDRTQSLVISTTPSHFAVVEEILRSLDQAPATPEADVQYIWLENADATEVAAQLNDMYKTRKGDKPIISADEFSNSITIIAKDAELKVIEPIITKLDDAAKDNSYRVRVIPLTSVKAEKMAEVLRSVYQQMTGNKVIVTEGSSDAVKGPEGESGPVGVEGPGVLPAPGAGADAQKSDAAEAPPPITIAVDKNSNSLIISGSRQELDYVQSLLDELMLSAMDVDAVFRVFKIEKADPDSVARTLDDLFNPKPRTQQRSQQRGQQGQQPAPPAPAPPPVISVVADLRTRTVIVRAKPVDFEDVEMLIKQLDQVPTVVSEVRIFPLKNTDATEVAGNLKELFQRAVQRTSQPRPQPQQSGSDQKGRPQPQQPQQQRVEMIRQVLELRTKQGITQVDIASMVNLSANRQTNSVIVTAPTDAMEIVAGIIEELDQSGMAAVTSVRMYHVKNGDVGAMVTALREVFGGSTRATPGATGRRATKTVLDKEIVISGDEAGRLIIVSAPADEHQLIESVLTQMDEAQGVGDVAIKVYRLENADASAVAAALSGTVERSRSGRTRRSAMGSATEGATGSLTGSGGQIQISADRSSNSIVVRAPAEEHLQIARLIEEMDQAPAVIVKTYPVKNAEVQTVVTALKDIFAAPSGEGTRMGRSGGTDRSRVSVTGDEAGRLIIVSAAAEKHELVAKIIDEIDQAQTQDQVTVKVYRLEYAEATDVASALQATIQKGGTSASGGSSPWSRWSRQSTTTGQVRINADRSSNSLIVRAGVEDHDQIAKLIEQLDVAPSDQYAVRLIPLANADPTAVAQVLNRVFGSSQSGSRSSRYGSYASYSSYGSYGMGSSGPRSNVVIEADRDARMLMVRADDETFEKIRELATQLDTASPGSVTEPVLIPLKFAQAASVASAVSQAFQPQRSTGRAIDPNDLVTVVAEPVSNSIIVTAGAKNLEKVKDLLGKLDSEATAGIRSEMLILENAQAEDLAPVLEKMAQTSTAATGARASRFGSAAGQEVVTVSAEKGSNALVISGPSNDVDKVLAMAKDLDKATTSSAAMVRVIQLTNGDAPEVAGMVQELYRQQYLIAVREKRSIDPLAVSSDARANAIVLATSDDMFKQVSEWVAQIEQMQPQRGALKIITLKHADPTEVEQAIRQIFGEATSRSVMPIRRSSTGSSTGTRTYSPRGSQGEAGPSGRQGPTGGKVETTVLPQQRSILINASDEDFDIIRKLAEALDAAAADAKRQFKVFSLKNTSNTRVALALTTLYRAVPGVAARPEDQVTVTALPDTNALVVSASAAKLEEVEHLIEQLDKEEIAPQLEFRIYPLENAQPTKVMPVLAQMLAQLQKTRPDEPISVQADERTRSIIVTARGPMFEQVEKIIKTLDKKPSYAEADVLIVPLKHADATRLATVLTEMLRPSETAVVTPEARALQEQVRLLKVRSADGRVIPELDLTKPIKITPDPTLVNMQGSNALLISSTPDNLVAMAAIVEVLDRFPLAEGTKVRVVHLKNADAESVTEILKDIFTQGQQLGGKEGTSVEGKAEPDSVSGKALVNPLNVSADLRTNSLVLSGLEESLALADLVIQDLDRDAGKIVTEVRVFYLQYADVTRLAPMLEAVFAESAPTPGSEGLKTQVTRLRTIFDRKKIGNATEVPKARAALTIQADPTTSAIVVAARSDVMPLIADVIKTMDIPGAGSLNVVQIVPLVNADATRLKNVIDGLFTGPNAEFVRAEDVPTVQVDTRTNALVVSASEKTFAMIGTLLKGLDAKQPIAFRDIRIVPLKNAEAITIGPVLQELMDARVQRFATLGAADAEALRVIILADARSNSLMIGGSAEGFQLAKSLAEQLDGASPAISGQIQLFPLEHANAGTISTTMQNLFDQRYQAARTTDVQRQRPIILPDVRVNALLVAANADDTKVIQGLLKKLDVELKDPSVQLVVIPMEHNDAGIIGPTLQRLFAARLQSMTLPGQTPVPQDRVDVETDALSNALIISASKENLALIKGLLAKVDVAPPDETGIVRMYPLQNSDAQRIATMLQGLVSQGLYKPGMVAAAANQALAEREKVSITVDTRTNTLIVSASKENFAVLEEIIRKIDSSEDFSVLGDLRMFALKNANATRLAPTLQQLFDAKRAAEQAAGGTGRMLPVSVIADARTNTLLVAGSRESFNAIEAMIRELDTDQVLAANEFRIFYLEQATAGVLQPTIEQLFTQRATRGDPSDPVTVLTEPRTNALIVSASPEDMKLVESLVARLDAEPDRPGTSIQVFPLGKADATQVANTLTSLYQAPGAAAGPAVGISVDERINAIVVQAGPSDTKRIGELVKELDTDSVPRVTEIRVFTLENADAAELAQILNDALNQKPTALTQTSPNRQALLQFVTRSKEGGQLITSALQEGVLITPDRRSNSLVISAPLENMPLLESLVSAMDSTAPRTAEIRVFTLINSDARAMALVLNELFRMQQTGTDKQAIEYTLVPTEGEAKGPVAVVGSAEDVALTVTVDIRTNSLLIGGTKHYIELATNVVKELDESTAAERLTEIYRLRNAQSQDIEAALTSFLEQERELLEQSLGEGAATTSQFILEREVVIVSEPTSNTLLLSASPRYYDVIAQMIEELDQPPPQVLIQVLLAEVSIDNTNEFGIDWRVTDTWQSHEVTGGTAPLFAASAGLQLNPGFQVSVTGGDVNFLLRAMESQGRLELLSRPQILASDNQQATINIGQRVPFITNSRVTDEGTTINTIQYEQVGIILDVIPRINPDGFVNLEVRPEISSIDDSTVPISEGVNAIIINSRSAETTVTVQDGHTIIIGGLITTTDRDRLNKVPVLGDIPILGNLFRSSRKVKERTELLIILTPTVLRNIEEADIETTAQLKRLDLLRGTGEEHLKDQPFDEFSRKIWEEMNPKPDTEKTSDEPAPRPNKRILIPARVEEKKPTP